MADVEYTNINDLAKESKQKDAKHIFPPIPLVVLAPLLVVIAIIAVAVPTSIVLNKASSDTTSLLASQYLSSLLNNVQVQASEPVRKMEPLVTGLLLNPATNATFNGAIHQLYNAPVVPAILTAGEAYELSTLTCYTAKWKPGFSNASTPSWVNNNYAWQYTVDYGVIQSTVYGGIRFLGVTEPGVATGVASVSLTTGKVTYQTPFPAGDVMFPYINQTGYYYFNSSIPTTNLYMGRPELGSFTYAIEPQMLPITTEMLGKTTPGGKDLEFSIARLPNGWKLGVVNGRHFSLDSTLPDYSCLAGLRIDDVWNGLLRKLKPPVDNSVVAMFGQDVNMAIAASSNMIVDESKIDEANGILFAEAVPDSFTLAVQAMLKSRYSSGADALAKIGTGLSFNTQVLGEKWVINLAPAEMNARDSDRFLVVAALPYHEIYGVIDSARKRGLGIAIGVGVSVAVLIAGIFILITLPLSRLAAQMAQLTKLDFGTLEQSGALNRRSVIWELRKVQTVFATMVRAFAGAIKKNKAMTGQFGGTSSNRGNDASKGGASFANTSSAALARSAPMK